MRLFVHARAHDGVYPIGTDEQVRLHRGIIGEMQHQHLLVRVRIFSCNTLVAHEPFGRMYGVGWREVTEEDLDHLLPVHRRGPAWCEDPSVMIALARLVGFPGYKRRSLTTVSSLRATHARNYLRNSASAGPEAALTETC